MEKVKNRILVITIIVLSLAGIYMGISYAANSCGGNESQIKKISLHRKGEADVDKIEIGCDYELATYAMEHPIRFVKSNLHTKVGEQLTLHYGGGKSTIYLKTAQCMYHQQANVSGSGGIYKIGTVIDIEGNKVKIYSKEYPDGKEITNQKAGAMAYCINKSMTAANSEKWKDAFSVIFNDAGGIKQYVDDDFLSQANWNAKVENESLITEAENHAASTVNREEPKKLSTDKPSTDNKDGGNIYLGPFKINKGDYTPKELKVTVDGGSPITKKKYYTKENGKYVEHTFSEQEISNDKAFYVKVDKVNSNWKVELILNYEKTISARIVLMSEHVAKGQNISAQAACDGAAFNLYEKKTLSWEGKKSDTPELEIIKVDANTKQPLLDVSFRISKMQGGKWQYIEKVTTNGIDYTADRNKAHIFTTDSDGIIKIKNATAGTYQFIETAAPKGYESNIGKAFTKVVSDKLETIVIENQKVFKFTIKKIGVRTDGTEETLANIGFKLKHEKYGYLFISEGKVKYTSNINNAQVFMTGSDGTVTIDNPGLVTGKYTFIETVNPYSEYESNVGMQQEFEYNTGDTNPIIIRNMQDRLGKLKIKKWGKKEDGTYETLANVKFIVYHIGTGKYLTGYGNPAPYGDYQYEFYTNSDGVIEIDNVKTGRYVVIEVENPNEGYELREPVVKMCDVWEGTASSEIEFINPTEIRHGALTLIKEGNNGKRLNRVGFKIKHNTLGYVRLNGAIEYTYNEGDATTFETYADGAITIYGLQVGSYTVYEMYNDNDPYEHYPNISFTKDVTGNDIIVEEDITRDYRFHNDSLRGNLRINKQDEITKEPLKDVTFILRNKNEGYVQSIGKDVVYTSNSGSAQQFITGEDGKVEIEGLEVGDYSVYEIYNGNEGYEKYPDKEFSATVNESSSGTISWSEETYGNPPLRGRLTIIKKVEGTDVLMGGVGFILEHKEKGYVSYPGIKAQYTQYRDDAYVFYTGTAGEDLGKVTVEGLLLGDYNLYEVENPHYGFEVNADEAIDVTTIVSGDNEKSIGNKQKYIKLRGYVWEDIGTGKGTIPNDYYDGDPDIRMNGIPVYLKQGNTIIADTITDSNGVYEFIDVEVEKLGNYYIEFEYDGLIYTNVIPHTDADNGSKAVEPKKERDALNKKFATIERGDKEDRIYGVAKDPSGDPTLDLKYSYSDHTAKIEQITTRGEKIDPWSAPKNPLLITANTNEAFYYIKEKYDELKQTQIVEWIDNINLGVHKREQPDVALVKDIQNVRLTINGYEHTYEYANRFNHPNEYDYIDGNGENQNMFNVGVKYGTDYGKKKYTRPIYESDYTWINDTEKSKELQVYITYRIQLKNEASSVRTIVNSIVDYYDSNYGEYVVGKGVDANRGKVTDDITDIKEENFEGGYKKLTINTNADLAPNSAQDIYIQFKIDRGKVAELLKDKKEGELSDEDKILDNIVEINSYSPRDKDSTPENVKYYAGIDKDSAPGNIDISNTDTWEDDTDKAPALQLQVAEGAREIKGMVFEDKTPDGLHTGKIREANGKYEQADGDRPVGGVKVKLVNEGTKNCAYNTSEVATAGDGTYTIKGFIPGNYEVVYTWGKNEGGLNVQEYKGTIYVDQARYTTIKQSNEASERTNAENIENKNSRVYKWYKDDNDNNRENYSDAIDDYNNRVNDIDPELYTKTYSSESGVNYNRTMDSTTPKMKIGVEYDDKAFTEYSDINKYVYSINNIDFGIVRRAKQSVELQKRVSKMKITLANGQVVSEIGIDEKGGKIVGDSTKHITYMGPLNDSAGFVKAELDNELLQGSKVEVIYEFKFVNKSEVDIMNENYYHYGSKVMNSGAYPLIDMNNKPVGTAIRNEVVHIKPTTIIDYLDRNWGYEQSRNTHWESLTKEEFERDMKDEFVSPAIFTDSISKINDRIILKTDKWKTASETDYRNDRFVWPEENVITLLEVSKTLTTTDDISLGNETEIIQLDKPGGSTIIKEENGSDPKVITPGSHIPGKTPDEPDTDESETVIVTPSTGANLAFVIPITIAVIALVILGTGIVLIKKKVIDIKE